MNRLAITVPAPRRQAARHIITTRVVHIVRPITVVRARPTIMEAGAQPAETVAITTAVITTIIIITTTAPTRHRATALPLAVEDIPVVAVVAEAIAEAVDD